MMGAIVKVNWWRGFFWTAGGFEVPLVFGVIALCVLLSGPGGLAGDRAIGLEQPRGSPPAYRPLASRGS